MAEIYGTIYSDTLIGTPDADFIYGWDFNVPSNIDGHDDLRGMGGDDFLFGGFANDILDGGVGADTMDGGFQRDTYTVDNVGDVVIEAYSDGGDDVVNTSVSFSVGSQFIETIVLIGSDAINAIGNDLSNTITGNAGSNIIDGRGGADTMSGLGGNDTYYVDNVGDTIQEAAGLGNDTVLTSSGFVLTSGASIEKLTTVDAGASYAINLFGNEFSQTILGNAGANAIDGKAGADVMYGYGGSDVYYVDSAGDVVAEAGGFGADKVLASTSYTLAAGSAIETLSTVNGLATTAINLTGNEFAQTIIGNAGANIINGKGRNDVLYGYGGQDTFVFNTAMGPANIDRIMDFSTADDTIRLENAVFTTIVGTGTLSYSQFRTNTTGQAHDADDRIIYETDTGNLFYDADGTGSGAAIQFATLTANLDITRSDFYVI